MQPCEGYLRRTLGFRARILVTTPSEISWLFINEVRALKYATSPIISAELRDGRSTALNTADIYMQITVLHTFELKGRCIKKSITYALNIKMDLITNILQACTGINWMRTVSNGGVCFLASVLV